MDPVCRGFAVSLNVSCCFRTKDEAFSFIERFCDHDLVSSVVVEPFDNSAPFKFDDFDAKADELYRLLGKNTGEILCKYGEVK